MKRMTVLVLALMLALSACHAGPEPSAGMDSPTPVSDSPEPARTEESAETTHQDEPLPPSTGKIYLYGEMHGQPVILEKEFELWYDHYHNDGMRHLFIESAYYSAEFLNLWMQADDDEILDQLLIDTAGTAGNVPEKRELYQKIKEQCPETVFHGTDVGHQHGTTGVRYLKYLEENGLTNSEQHRLTEEAIQQGEFYYAKSNHVYRENMMVKNFIREFDKLRNEDVMGIYGSAHTGLDELNFTDEIPSMGSQLYQYYGDSISSENLSWMAGLGTISEPLRMDVIEVAGKEYQAAYFGKDETSFRNIVSREYWRLEDAYEDFKDAAKTGDSLPYNHYPMKIEVGQVFIVDVAYTDGTVERYYNRSDGNTYKDGAPITEGFLPE